MRKIFFKHWILSEISHIQLLLSPFLEKVMLLLLYFILNVRKEIEMSVNTNIMIS